MRRVLTALGYTMAGLLFLACLTWSVLSLWITWAMYG